MGNNRSVSIDNRLDKTTSYYSVEYLNEKNVRETTTTSTNTNQVDLDGDDDAFYANLADYRMGHGGGGGGVGIGGVKDASAVDNYEMLSDYREDLKKCILKTYQRQHRLRQAANGANQQNLKRNRSIQVGNNRLDLNSLMNDRDTFVRPSLIRSMLNENEQVAQKTSRSDKLFHPPPPPPPPQVKKPDESSLALDSNNNKNNKKKTNPTPKNEMTAKAANKLLRSDSLYVSSSSSSASTSTSISSTASNGSTRPPLPPNMVRDNNCPPKPLSRVRSLHQKPQHQHHQQQHQQQHHQQHQQQQHHYHHSTFLIEATETICHDNTCLKTTRRAKDATACQLFMEQIYDSIDESAETDDNKENYSSSGSSSYQTWVQFQFASLTNRF